MIDGYIVRDGPEPRVWSITIPQLATLDVRPSPPHSSLAALAHLFRHHLRLLHIPRGNFYKLYKAQGIVVLIDPINLL